MNNEEFCDGCCYRVNCNHDLEKCCYLVKHTCYVENMVEDYIKYNNGEIMSKGISNKNMYKMAEDIKSHVEKGGTGLPSSLTYEGVKYTWQDMMYIMPYGINHLNCDCYIPNLIAPENPWKGDNIDEQVLKDDFLKQGANIINYIHNHDGQIPNYVTTIKTGKKVNANHFTFCFAKSLVWYKKHNNVLPSQCLYRSTDVKKASATNTSSNSTSAKPVQTTVQTTIDNSKHYGYWVFGRDMYNVNLETLRNNGVTDILLNYYAFEAHGENKVLSWIKEATDKGIGVHIWMQCFYDGEWHNPVNMDLTSKKQEVKRYANMSNVKGVHLDYLRYPGTAYKTEGGADAITRFVKEVREENKNILLTCAVMPEESCKYYYGQDLEALGKIVDAIIPMVYKGNYNKDTNWIKDITSKFGKNGVIWTGLQSYKSDENTSLLSEDELKTDIQSAINGGAKGVMLFRYGLSQNIKFQTPVTTTTSNHQQAITNDTSSKTKFISNANIYKMAQDVKDYVEKTGKFLYKGNYGGVEFTWNEMQDILTYCLLHLDTNINAGTYKWCENADGDNINEKIYTDDYLDQARRVHDYILKNGQIPNYTKTVKSGKKVDIDLFTYCVSKILVFYKNNGQLPNYCVYNSDDMGGSPSPSGGGLKPYLENQGCSGMGQCNGYYCACNALQQCFYRLTGILVDESTIASWAGTTTSGTGHSGIDTAVAQFNRKYGKNVKITWKNFSEVGWDGMQKAIENGAMLNHILYRDTDGHYEVPKQITSDNVIVLNSLGNRCNYPAYCGYIETRTKSTHLRYINGISQKSIAILTNG